MKRFQFLNIIYPLNGCLRFLQSGLIHLLSFSIFRKNVFSGLLKISFEIFYSRLEYICGEERVNVSEEAIDLLIDFCDGDLRKSITYLQSLSKITTPQTAEQSSQVLYRSFVFISFVIFALFEKKRLFCFQKVTAKQVFEIVGLIDNEWIEKLIKACKTGKYETVEAVVQVAIFFKAYTIKM